MKIKVYPKFSFILQVEKGIRFKMINKGIEEGIVSSFFMYCMLEQFVGISIVSFSLEEKVETK